MNKSRNEIDFIRLLRQCQSIADCKKRNWRFEKFVDSLSEKLDSIRCQNANLPPRDTLEEYGRKVQYFIGLIETEKFSSVEKRMLATELSGRDLIKESKNRQKGDEMRDFLCSRRRRGDIRSRQKTFLVEEEEVLEESVTEELLRLAKSIRENHAAANASIKNDIEILSQVSSNADVLSLKMKQSNDKLAEFVRKSGQFGILIMLMLVTFTFFFMVIFIRLFPKPTT